MRGSSFQATGFALSTPRPPTSISTATSQRTRALDMAASNNTGSKSDQIRTLLASGMAPADIARQVGCSRNLVYVVKAKLGGGKKPRARRATAPKSKSAGRTSGNDDLIGRFMVSVKELESERDELRAVLDRIRQLVNGVV